MFRGVLGYVTCRLVLCGFCFSSSTVVSPAWGFFGFLLSAPIFTLVFPSSPCLHFALCYLLLVLAWGWKFFSPAHFSGFHCPPPLSGPPYRPRLHTMPAPYLRPWPELRNSHSRVVVIRNKLGNELNSYTSVVTVRTELGTTDRADHSPRRFHTGLASRCAHPFHPHPTFAHHRALIRTPRFVFPPSLAGRRLTFLLFSCAPCHGPSARPSPFFSATIPCHIRPSPPCYETHVSCGLALPDGLEDNTSYSEHSIFYDLKGFLIWGNTVIASRRNTLNIRVLGTMLVMQVR